MYGQGGEHRVKIWVLDHKGERYSGKYDLNMLMKYLMKEISFNMGHDYNEDVFTVEQENNYMFLTTSKFKFLYIKGFIGPLLYSHSCINIFLKMFNKVIAQQWVIDCNYAKLQRLRHLLRRLERQVTILY